ncbi:MAG: hypothetical protein FK730_16270 [Asgard group archaeon]|nr:hypothetical protein [Asgard group archaeon]
MRKKFLSISLGFILSIILLQTIPISGQYIPTNGANFVLSDETQDIIHFSEGINITVTTSAYDEIDIEEFVIDGLIINITFVDIPVWGVGYLYTCFVSWNGDDDGSHHNYTEASWSNGLDEVRTRLLDSTGALIVNNYQEGIIDPAGKSLLIPILNASLITNVLSPVYITVEALYSVIGTPEFYEDNLLYNANKGLSGFNIGITVVSLISLVIASYILIRRKIVKK